MATTTKDAPRSLAKLKSDQAFGTIAEAFSLSKQATQTLFATIAKDCETNEEKWLYLQTCKAYGLNPLMKQLHASKRGGQLALMLSYYVFVSRARTAGYLIQSSPVYGEDKWGGFDEIAGKPVSHVAPLVRKTLIGAWACAIPVAGGPCVGAFLPVSELLPPPLWGKDNPKWRESGITDRTNIFDCIAKGAYGPMWTKMPARMAEKCIVAHVGRRVAPDLEALYSPEEFGLESQREAPISELAEADIVSVDGQDPNAPPKEPEAKTASEQIAEANAPQQVDAKPVDGDGPPEPAKNVDQRILEILEVKDDTRRKLLRQARAKLDASGRDYKKQPRTVAEKEAFVLAIERVWKLLELTDSDYVTQTLDQVGDRDVAEVLLAAINEASKE